MPADTTRYQIKKMAKSDVEKTLYQSIDYVDYGKNWEIIDYHFT